MIEPFQLFVCEPCAVAVRHEKAHAADKDEANVVVLDQDLLAHVRRVARADKNALAHLLCIEFIIK